jgi:hypothetical protein
MKEARKTTHKLSRLLEAALDTAFVLVSPATNTIGCRVHLKNNLTKSNNIHDTYKPEVNSPVYYSEKKLKKVQRFLQVSSLIIAKNRHRSWSVIGYALILLSQFHPF